MKMILFLMLMLAIPLVFASDEELFSIYIGDEESYTYQQGDNETNALYFSPTTSTAAAGGGGGASRNPVIVSTPYYDIMLSGIKATYNIEEIIDFNITLINKGDLPDRDAVLVYYLLGPDDERYGQNREVFEEVPPTCPGGVLDKYTQICTTPGGSTFNPYLYVLPRQIALPLETTEGGWEIHVEYETQEQPLITIQKAFRVGGYPLIVIIGVIVLLMVFANMRKNKTKRTGTAKW